MIKILKYGEVANSEIFARTEPTVNVEDIVADIIANVRKNGDAALKEYCLKFDKAELDSLQVSEDEIDEAMTLVEPKFIDILERAAKNIRNFHEKQVRNSFIINNENGIVIGQKVIPVDRAGLYVPGGTAAYPSTVLMDSIPAKIAGCSEICITTPPGKDGKVNPVILAAAKIAGVDRIFKVGGAQAVAALAFGTESIPKVDKIVGPGNAFVAEAKKQVFGNVSIDMIAGPSEILVIADAKSNAKFVAADLLSQAEHDKMASAVLVTDSMEFAEKVAKVLKLDVKAMPMVKTNDTVSRVAVVSGCGKDEIAAVLEAGADTFVTGEVMHNHMIDCKELGLNLICGTHYATERIIVPTLAEIVNEFVPCDIYQFTREEEYGI